MVNSTRCLHHFSDILPIRWCWCNSTAPANLTMSPLRGSNFSPTLSSLIHPNPLNVLHIHPNHIPLFIAASSPVHSKKGDNPRKKAHFWFLWPCLLPFLLIISWAPFASQMLSFNSQISLRNQVLSSPELYFFYILESGNSSTYLGHTLSTLLFFWGLESTDRVVLIYW